MADPRDTYTRRPDARDSFADPDPDYWEDGPSYPPPAWWMWPAPALGLLCWAVAGMIIYAAI